MSSKVRAKAGRFFLSAIAICFLLIFFLSSCSDTKRGPSYEEIMLKNTTQKNICENYGGIIWKYGFKVK